MMEKSFLATVIIPTYNYACYIKQAINSILNSDFPQDQIEIIVIDDGSQDNTSEIVAKYGSRIKYIFQENAGKAWATKIGIDNCQGKYIFNLDADDVFLPNKIKEVVQIFESDPDIVHVAHPAFYWDVKQDKKSLEPVPKNILGNKIWGRDLLVNFYRNRILFGGGSTFATTRETLKKFSIPKEVDMYIDEYLVMCTLNIGYSYFIDSPLSLWRIHGNNYSEVTTKSFERKRLRSMKSKEGVLNNLNNFDDEILKLYKLNYVISGIADKENTGQKKVLDIINMWSFFLTNFNVFNPHSFKIIKSYTMLNRTVPKLILDWLRGIKYKK